MSYRTPTKADPLSDRLVNTFGKEAIRHQLDRMLSLYGDNDPLRYLTDEACAELTQRLLAHHKFARKIRSHNRRIAANGQLK